MASRVTPDRLETMAGQSNTCGLMQYFFVFEFRDRVGDNTGARMECRHALLDCERADCDGKLALIVEPKVADRPCVEASRMLLQLLDDFHRPFLWRPSDRSSGECRAQGGRMRNP